MPAKFGDKFTLDHDHFEVEVIAVLPNSVLVKYPNGDQELIGMKFDKGEYLVRKRETITEKDGRISIIEIRTVGVREGREEIDLVAYDEDGIEFRLTPLIQGYKH